MDCEGGAAKREDNPGKQRNQFSVAVGSVSLQVSTTAKSWTRLMIRVHHLEA